MKLHHILMETEVPEYLYHVTQTKNVDNIKKKGLIQFQPSNWVRGGPDGDRYNDEAGVFAFTDPEDALKWALKMEWDMDDKDISIVRLNIGEYWEDDPSEDPVFTMMAKGKARRSRRNIKADEIIDSFRMEPFGKPGPLNIPVEEWTEKIAKKLKA